MARDLLKRRNMSVGTGIAHVSVHVTTRFVWRSGGSAGAYAMMGGLLRDVARRVGSDGAILCYHSITTPQGPSASRLHVPLHEFETTVRLLRRFADVVALRDLISRRDSGLGTAGLVALTFDDGYAALLEGVRQTVERDHVPITVFVVSDAAGTGSRYW